ncbi:hypothetical protein BSKO_11064 [Bryopsis sp. KO-2023]|nr:hypothetical protein BSKO_11064 [Bryopsis sp. KO-2023]
MRYLAVLCVLSLVAAWGGNGGSGEDTVRIVGSQGAKLEFTNPDTLFDASTAGYTQIVSTRGRQHIFVSGQTALQADGTLPDDAVGNKARQFELVFENVQRAIDAIPKATLKDVVSIKTYVKDYDPDADLPLVATFGNKFPNPPANDLLGLQSLALKDLLVEVSLQLVL